MSRGARAAPELSPRRSLVDVLSPPAGYHFDAGIATTFGLDATALTCALGALAKLDVADEGDARAEATTTTNAKPGDLLRAFATVRDRLLVVRQGGQMRVTGLDAHHGLAALCDRAIRAITPEHGSFHPKVWLLRYRDGREVVYRFVCSSRNLTASSCLELGVAFELERSHTTTELGETLADFLSEVLDALPGRTGRRVPRWATELVREARFLDPPKDAFRRGTTVSLLPQTPRHGAGRQRASSAAKRSLERLLARAERQSTLTCVAPFLDTRWIAHVASKVDELTIVSTREALDAIADEVTGLRTRSHERVRFRAPRLASEAPTLHAKLLHLATPRSSVTVMGSANATSPAWGLGQAVNWECGVVFEPGLRRSELRAIAEDWTEPYRPQAAGEQTDLEAKRALDDFERAIARRLQPHAAWNNGTLRIRATSVPKREGFEAALAPIFTSGVPSEERFAPLEHLEGDGATFECSLEQLTTMVAVRVRKKGAEACAEPLVIELASTDFPSDWNRLRDRAVLDRLAESAGGLAGVLWDILSNGAARPTTRTKPEGAPGPSASTGGTWPTAEITLEHMLLAAADPTVAGQIHAVLDGRSRDPDGFGELWEVVRGPEMVRSR